MSDHQDFPGDDEDNLNDPDALFDSIEDVEAEEEEKAEAEPHPSEIIAALNEENVELKDRALRIAADMENLRRRTEREVNDAKKYAVSKFARDILAVSDNLARALEAVPMEIRETADDAMKGLLEGVEMTERELQNSLSKNGVIKLEPEGEKFDPNLHQAMFEVPNPQVLDGTVAQVVQAGYKIGDRVLRPAMVGVARGGPKQAAQPAPAQPEADPGHSAGEAGANVDKSV